MFGRIRESPATPAATEPKAPKIILPGERDEVKAARARMGVARPWKMLPLELSPAGIAALDAKPESLQGSVTPYGKYTTRSPSPSVWEAVSPKLRGFLLSKRGKSFAAYASDCGMPLSDTIAEVSEFAKGVKQMRDEVGPVTVASTLSSRGSAIVTVMAIKKSSFMVRLTEELSVIKRDDNARLNFISTIADAPLSGRLTLCDSCILRDFSADIDPLITGPAIAPPGEQRIFAMGYMMKAFLDDPWSVVLGMRGPSGRKTMLFTNANPTLAEPSSGLAPISPPAITWPLAGYDIVTPRPKNSQGSEIESVTESVKSDALTFLGLNELSFGYLK